MSPPSAPSGIPGTKMELVTRPVVGAGSRPPQSETLESPYNSGGRCAHFYQESCLLLLALFLLFIGLSLTVVAAYFNVWDLYILGPPMLIIGFVMFLVGTVYVVKKIKLRARVAAANRQEEEAKQFTSFHPLPRAPKQPNMPSMPNGHVAERKPTESDLYGNNNTEKLPIDMDIQKVIVEDLAHYVAPVGSKPEDSVPRVCFPKSPTDGTIDTRDSIYTTPLARLHESPEKTLTDPTSDIVPSLESRDSTKVSFASEPVVIAAPSPEEHGLVVPDAVSYTPISLTKVEIEDYAKYGGSAIT
ncbi:uncharacterized protein LOC135502443 [Lineus longissimus]|uniref:uncharacterized protein LOC135502443 n=1 Tax=Lineus longissimus TaxID=88925 RepID=UPI00315CB0F5